MELSLVDIPGAPKSDPGPESGTTAPSLELAGVASGAPADPFLADATREYEEGRVDLPLWAHAIAKHDHDQPRALEFYLRSRATALRLERRERGNVPPTPLPSAAVAPRRPTTEASNDPEETVSGRFPGIPRLALRHAAIALPVVVGLAFGGWWLLSGPGEGTAKTAASGSTAVLTGVPKAAVPAAKAAPAAPVDPVKQLELKMQELKSAGNWNVFVLYAGEWTRKQPSNAVAWRELSIGYANLRQYNDALEAATKATQLAPDDVLAWRNLGQVNLDLREPEAALKSYERAATLDPTDLFSLLNVGEINALLGRLPQARTAFDAALALNADNQEAMCGAVQVAQRQGRGKDVDGMARALRAADHKCSDATASVAVTVAPAVHPGATMSTSTSGAAVSVSKAPMPFSKVPASVNKAR